MNRQFEGSSFWHRQTFHFARLLFGDGILVVRGCETYDKENAVSVKSQRRFLRLRGCYMLCDDIPRGKSAAVRVRIRRIIQCSGVPRILHSITHGTPSEDDRTQLVTVRWLHSTRVLYGGSFGFLPPICNVFAPFSVSIAKPFTTCFLLREELFLDFWDSESISWAYA